MNFYLYMYDLVKEIIADIKSNNGSGLMYFAWFLISLACGFGCSLLLMILHSCYVHHMQENKCNLCNHEDMLKFTMIICIGSILGIIF